MPFDYSRCLRDIESRARKLRGLSVGSRTATGTSLLVLAVMIVVRMLRVPLPSWSLAAFVLPPLAAGVAGYVYGRSGQPRTPHLLLRIDDALGLSARFSSLYELRQRGGDSIFRRQIEAEVRDAATQWRTALPIDKRTIVGGSAGACCIALAVALAFVPLPEPKRSPFDMLDQALGSSQDPRPEAAAPLATPMTSPTAPLTLKPGSEADRESGPAMLDGPDRGQTLEDVMRDLSGMSPNEAVLVPLSPDDIEELADLQRQAMRAITELLEDIRDRLENSPSSEPPELTEQELQALERELDRGALPPELQEGLNELMNRQRPRSVEEIVEQLIDQFGDEEGSEGESSEGGESGSPQSTAVAPNQQDIEELLDELGQASSDAQQSPEGGVPAGPDEGDGTTQDSNGDGAPSDGGRSDDVGDAGIEDPNAVGGADGPGGSSDERDEREAGFIREEDPAKIGSEGEFASEFVTEGVPIELMPDSASGEPSFRVSYEQIVSILRERGLPDGAIKIVRDYFNAITEGGP